MYGILTTSLWPSGSPIDLLEQMPTRVLGRTGRNISILGLGGHHIGQIQDDREAIRLIRTAIDMGITFMDNAWEYHQGRSEMLMGKALQDGYREPNLPYDQASRPG